MSAENDRRIQLRESVHQVVTRAANLRGVTPAAFVSVAVYEYLRERGELAGVQFATTTPPVEPSPLPAPPSPPAKRMFIFDDPEDCEGDD